MHPVSQVEVAETTKVVENAHRYLQIAFAEDLYLYCQANSINFAELRNALNTKWNVEILEPREGIGGHCLPKDTKMFLQSSKAFKSKMLTAAIEVDEDYRSYRRCRDNGIISPSSRQQHNNKLRTKVRRLIFMLTPIFELGLKLTEHCLSSGTIEKQILSLFEAESIRYMETLTLSNYCL